MFQKHVRLSIVGERVGKPALPPRACSGCASRRAKAQSSARKQAQRRRQEAVLATQGGGRRTAAGQGTGVRRRSPQAYRDEPSQCEKANTGKQAQDTIMQFLPGYASLWPSHATARSDSRRKAQVEFSPFAQAPRISGKNCIGAFDTETSTRNWPERLDGKTRALESLRAETKRRGLDWGGWTTRLDDKAGRKGHPERGFCQSLFLKREQAAEWEMIATSFVLRGYSSRKREQAAGRAACSRTSETRRTSVSLKHTLHGQLSFVKNILRKDFSPVPFA